MKKFWVIGHTLKKPIAFGNKTDMVKGLNSLRNKRDKKGRHVHPVLVIKNLDTQSCLFRCGM